MFECPTCGYGNAHDTDFCANPDCRTFRGFGGRRPAPPGGPASARPAPPPVHPATSVRPMAGTPTARPQIRGQRRGVRLKLEPADLNVEPGSVTTASLTVRNVGTRVEGFSLALNGPAAAFGTIDPPALTVFPDATQQAVVRFMPARGPQHPAGRADFRVLAHSQMHSDVVGSERGSVTVGPFDQVSAALEPEVTRGRKPGLHSLILTNSG